MESSTIAPPIGGPSPEAMAAAAPHSPTPCTRRESSKPSITSARDAAMSSAAPRPCRTRKAMSCPTELATMQSTEVSAKTTTPTMKTRLRLSRSANRPAATRNAAKTML